ncbi:TRM11 family SAM-dependent methyltransferase [Streptacidiphilus albus]|uniref:TRM11 family SAM-dependent methyltransferase n=1 Tax=Streptacidiphilus albus TaxID=105425 RepID=UPI0007C6BCED|nr:DNA methyltransferase [Streptacidiphilus albus]
MTTPTHPHRREPGARPEPPDATLASLPTSVWVTAQQDSRTQRKDRYLPEAMEHPARMLPAIARHAVTTYTRPGDTVLDPMCGIGTTLVEAVHLDRHAVGVELEPQWPPIARRNLQLAYAQGAPGTGHVYQGDGRHAADLVDSRRHGPARLLLTSPPYGGSLHGQVRATRDTGRPGIFKFHDSYGNAPGNLAHAPTDELLTAFTAILTGCRSLLADGATIAVTARPWREHGELVDLPAAVIGAGRAAGLVPVERCIALLAGVRDDHLVARGSFHQLRNIRNARAQGVPMHLIVHEDVLLFRYHSAPPATPGDGYGSVPATCGFAAGIVRDLQDIRPTTWPDAATWSSR